MKFTLASFNVNLVMSDNSCTTISNSVASRVSAQGKDGVKAHLEPLVNVRDLINRPL